MYRAGRLGMAHARRVCSDRFFELSALIGAFGVQNSQPSVAQIIVRIVAPFNRRTQTAFLPDLTLTVLDPPTKVNVLRLSSCIDVVGHPCFDRLVGDPFKFVP